MRVLAELVSGEDPIRVSSCGGRGEGAMWVPSIRALVPFRQTPLSRPHLPMAPSPVLSQWGLGFNVCILRTQTFSHSRLLEMTVLGEQCENNINSFSHSRVDSHDQGVGSLVSP